MTDGVEVNLKAGGFCHGFSQSVESVSSLQDLNETVECRANWGKVVGPKQI